MGGGAADIHVTPKPRRERWSDLPQLDLGGRWAMVGDGVRGDGVRGDGVRGDGVRGDGVRGDGVRSCPAKGEPWPSIRTLPEVKCQDPPPPLPRYQPYAEPGVFSLCRSRPIDLIPFSFPFRANDVPPNPRRSPARWFRLDGYERHPPPTSFCAPLTESSPLAGEIVRLPGHERRAPNRSLTWPFSLKLSPDKRGGSWRALLAASLLAI
jgi:hypothetical protein